MSRLPRVVAAMVVAAILPLSLPAVAADDEFKLVIENHRFTPAELVVPIGRKVTLVIENRDATPEEFESKTLGREKVVAAKSTATVIIGPLKAGSYSYVGEFHEATAKGVIVAR